MYNLLFQNWSFKIRWGFETLKLQDQTSLLCYVTAKRGHSRDIHQRETWHTAECLMPEKEVDSS